MGGPGDARGADLRYGQSGDGRRSGAVFGVRTGTTGCTHSTRLPSALPRAVRPALTASRACSCSCAPIGTSMAPQARPVHSVQCRRFMRIS